MTDIDVKNYDPGDFVPRGIVNLVEGRQLPSAADQPWKVCLVGASLFPEAVGDPLAPANVPVRVGSEKPAETSDTTTEASGASAVELFGAGSELHLMCRAAFRAYPGVELWGVPIEVPDETGYEKATATLTVAGTAGRPGEWTIVIHDTPVGVRIEDEADPQATLEAIAAALELQTDLPVLPGAITDGDVPGTKVLTIEAKHRGENGNYIDIYRKGGTAGQSLTVTRFAAAGNPGAKQVGADAVTGTPHALAAGNVDGQLSQILAWLNTHVGAASGAHAASAIAAAAHNHISGTSVQAQLQEIVDDLESTNASLGAAKVGNAAVTGSPNSLTAGTVRDHLTALLTDINNHQNDSSDAHDASAISVADAGGIITARPPPQEEFDLCS